MNGKEKRNEKFRKFNFDNVPKCKHVVKKKVNNMVIELCMIRKGVGRLNQYCAFCGQYPKCKYYASKRRWGRSLIDMAGEFLYEP